MKKIDFALNWSTKVKENFIHFLKERCNEKELSFLWVHEDNYKKVIKELESHQRAISVLLDTEATFNLPKDPYARVCYAVKDAGGMVINDPDRTKIAIDKSATHFELVNAGITTPYTVVVRNWEPANFKLTEKEKQMLGLPFVIKPALGFGQQGVVKEAQGSIREIACARHFDRGDNFLLQEKIVPIQLNGRRAWFRVFNVFNTLVPCWWDDQQNHYEHITFEEFNTHSLFPLVKIASKISSLTKMTWFSTEITIDKKNGKNRFVAIDYVNDQCDMSTLSETSSGLPDYIVEYIAHRIVDSSQKLMRNEKSHKKYSIWLKDATIELKGLARPSALLKQVTTI
ncbi:hypothetical protein ACFL56_01860 [Candidatus Margulisiibacteriota bacterium]